MSIISEFISIFGADNINTIAALIITSLAGKTSWDVYKSKDIVKHYELKSRADALKNNIEETKESIAIVNRSITAAKEELAASNAIISKLENKLEDKINDLDVKIAVTNQKVSTLLDGVVTGPKISRVEARRLKSIK